MIQKETKILIFDNSGAKIVRCFRFCSQNKKKYSLAGHVVAGSVVTCNAHKRVTKKQIYKVLLLLSKKQLKRKNGFFLKSDVSSGVLLLDNFKPVGTRIFGPVVREVCNTTTVVPFIKLFI